jgi:hypothetical protein
VRLPDARWSRSHKGLWLGLIPATAHERPAEAGTIVDLVFHGWLGFYLFTPLFRLLDLMAFVSAGDEYFRL